MESISIYAHITLPILIFIAKILDVSMGTIRIVLISKNKRRTASILSFFEMFIWLMAISNIMKNLDNLACCIAYAVGYAAGVYSGMIIEEKLFNGKFASYMKKLRMLSLIVPDRTSPSTPLGSSRPKAAVFDKKKNNMYLSTSNFISIGGPWTRQHALKKSNRPLCRQTTPFPRTLPFTSPLR